MRLATTAALCALLAVAAAAPPVPAPSKAPAPATAAAANVQVSDASRAMAAPVVSFLKKLIPDDAAVKLPNGATLTGNDGKAVSKADFVRTALSTAQNVAPEVAEKAAIVANQASKGSTETQDKYKAAFAKAQTMAANQNKLTFASNNGASLASLASANAAAASAPVAADSPWANLAAAAQAQGIQMAGPATADAAPADEQAAPLAHAPPRRAGPAP